ncbi:MAG: major facilitator superfamily 1 [Actinomycetia bacterium]|nr:major facilitator superfamily 1 [Actinomycetes bacterium]
MADRARAHLVLAAVAGAATVYGAQGISPALPALQHAIGFGDSALGLFTAAYMLPGVVLAIPLGYLADALGRRKVFVSMALLYGGAGAAQALATNFNLLLGLRVLQGVGFASLMPLSVTLIADTYLGMDQLKGQAWRQVSMTGGEFVFPLVGAALAAWSWRAPLAAQGLLIPVAFAGLFVLDDKRSKSVGSGKYGNELVEAVRLPGMPAVLGAGFLRFWCKFALVAYLPFMLVHSQGATLGEAALALSIASGVAACVNFLVVRALRRVSPSRMLIAAVLLVGGSLVLFAVVPSWQLALVVAVVYGLGDGTLMVLQNAFVSVAAPEGVRGGLLAVSGMIRNAGKLVAPLAVGGLILAVSPAAAFALMGVSTVALVPMLRPLRLLDGLLRPEKADPLAPAVEAA